MNRDLDFWRTPDDLRGTWQARLLAAVPWNNVAGLVKPLDKMAAAVLSVLAESFEPTLWPLMCVTFPKFVSIVPPFFVTAAKISRGGRVYADMTTKSVDAVARVIVFRSEREMEGAFRRLADRLSFTDAERVEMFAAVKKWIVCDYRIDPNTGEKEEKVA